MYCKAAKKKKTPGKGGSPNTPTPDWDKDWPKPGTRPKPEDRPTGMYVGVQITNDVSFWVKSEVAERAKRAEKKLTTQQKVKKEHWLGGIGKSVQPIPKRFTERYKR